jgi:tRNA uridine 5-carboxymethylaminomethyl modification enzyme
VAAAGVTLDDVAPDAWLCVEIGFRYEGYLARERESAARLAEMASFHLPPDLPYDELRCISTEARQKLARIRPDSLGQASRVPGVSPSDLQGIVMEVVRRRRASA